MENKLTTNYNASDAKRVGGWKFILGFFVFLYKTAIRP